MTSNGSRPLRRPTTPRIRRPLALALGAVAAVLIAAVLVAPVVILGGGGGSTTTSCTPTLRYQGRDYVARKVSHAVEAVAIGVGVASGCGTSPLNVDLRSLVGVAPAAAVGLTADQSSIYVRRGVCASASTDGLLACLRRSG